MAASPNSPRKKEAMTATVTSRFSSTLFLKMPVTPLYQTS